MNMKEEAKEDIDSINQQEDWYDELPDEVKISIKQSFDDLKHGRVTPHEVIMEKYKKWLKNKD